MPATDLAPDAAPGPADAPTVAWTALPRAAVTWWRAQALLPLAALAALVATASALDAPRTVTGLAVVLTVGVPGAMWVAAARRWHAWRYAVTDTHVLLAWGRWWRCESVVPRDRILHIDVRRSPLHRALALAAVDLYTAGSVGGHLIIPAVTVDEAHALRDRLLHRPPLAHGG